MGSDTLKDKLDKIVDEAYDENDDFTFVSVDKAVRKAYELGKSEKKKKVKNNPYSIDYERQTVLEL